MTKRFFQTICLAFLFIIINQFSLFSQENFPMYSWDSTWDGAPIEGGTIYNKNGLEVSFQVIEKPDPWGNTKIKCEINEESYWINDQEKWANGRTLTYYGVIINVKNNSGKEIRFTHVPAISLHIESPDEPIAHTCRNSTGGPYDATLVITSMGPGGAIEAHESNGSWFFSKPKVTSYSIGSYILQESEEEGEYIQLNATQSTIAQNSEPNNDYSSNSELNPKINDAKENTLQSKGENKGNNATLLEGTYKTKVETNKIYGSKEWSELKILGDGKAIWTWNDDFKGSTLERPTDNCVQQSVFQMEYFKEDGKYWIKCESKKYIYANCKEKDRNCFPHNIEVEIVPEGLIVKNGLNGEGRLYTKQ